MPLAIFRTSQQQEELTKLASKHIQSDLEPSDHEALRKATRRIATSTTVASLIGLGLGIYAAIRLRKMRTDMFAAFRTADKPTHVLFENGRKEAIPDITPMMRPTKWGDAATYFFFGLGGTMVGGELGLLTGTWSASRGLSQDPARRERIEKAYRLLRIDVLQTEAARLQGGGTALHV
ncbi:hypothetical protein F4802DRAFT_611055 [Xylaria palmicola]|nr:hypothetical protein F4802DRAFT_611055 [Xylaria palmicola]